MDGVVLFYLAAAATLVAGVLWFRVVRPMLEGFRVIAPASGVRSEPLESRESVNKNTPPLVEAQTPPEKERTSSELIRISDTEPPQKPRLTELEAARTLARMQKVDGSWWLSANKIHEIVGGQRSEVLDAVRDERPDPAVRAVRATPSDDTQPARVVTVRHRDGERRITWYPDDPALEFEPPR